MDSQQRLVEMLIERTGQPREQVEQWVARMIKMLQGSFTVYDVSRMVGGFIAKHARQATPYVLKFGRSLLESFVEEQRRLHEQQRQLVTGGDTISQRARSGETIGGKRRPARLNSRYRIRYDQGGTKGTDVNVEKRAAEKIGRNQARNLVQGYLARGKSVRRNTDRTNSVRHNPWAPLSVLLQQPIYISTYRLRRAR